MISLKKIICYDIVASPSFMEAKIFSIEEIEKIKILEKTKKRNLLLEKLLKED